MSISHEITRLQNAKASLKTSINAKTDLQHKIDDETLDDYADFVDSIQTGGSIDTTDIRNVINMTGANVTSETDFDDYPQDLYDGYIDVLKNQNTLINNMPKSTFTGTSINITNIGLPPFKIQLSKGNIDVSSKRKNFINNANLNYTYTNISPSQITLTTINTGIRYLTTYNTSGKPFVIFNTGIDLTSYIGKTVRMKSTFANGGGIRLVIANANASSRETMIETTTSEEEISYVVPNNLGDKKYLCYGLFLITPNVSTVDFTNLMMTMDFDDTTYLPYGNNWIYTTISDGINSKKTLIPLDENKIAGINNSGDKVIVDYYGKCYYYIESTSNLIDLDYTTNTSLYNGTNIITNSDEMNMEIKYIKNTFE